jgi:DNA-binding transcriptional ArsR family regulator
MDQYRARSLSEVFHALGDPNRLAMVQRTRQGEVPAGELAKELSITLTATLKHLAVLEKAGLMRSIKVGRERRCQLELQALSSIEAWIEETRRAWNLRLDSLESFLLAENES